MDSTSIELSGSEITQVQIDGDRISVHFAPAFLVKIMTGSVERTRWRQDGALVFTGAVFESPAKLPDFPCTCAGGDVGENVFTYRDMIPVPLHSRGRAHCVLKLAGHTEPLSIQAIGVDLEMQGVPKYIEHVRPD